MYNPLSVIAQYFPFDDFMFTYNLDSAIVAADEGKAVMLDTSGPNKVKLTTDGARVAGRLFKFEDRSQQGGGKVGTVERKLRAKLPMAAGLTGINLPAVGDTVVGSATAGAVKCLNNGTAKTPDHSQNVVIEVDATGLTVTVELF